MQMPAVSLKKDIFRSDFAVEARSSMPRLAVAKMKWNSSPHPNQIIDIVNMWSEAIDGEPDEGAWSASKEYATEYWSMMSATAVQGAAFLYGLADKLVKSSAIERLIAIMAWPVRPEVIADTVRRFQILSRGEVDPGPAALDLLPGQTTGQAKPKKKAPAARIPRKRKPGSDPVEPSPPVGGEDDDVDVDSDPPLDDEGRGSAPASGSINISDKALLKLLKAVRTKKRRRGSSSDDSDSDSSDSDAQSSRKSRGSYAAFCAKVDKSVARRKYFDFTMLGEKYVEVMLLRDCGMKSAAVKAMYSSFDPVATPQGILAWIALCAKSEKFSRAEVADMLEWYSLVLFTEDSTPMSRATYMKRFMAVKMKKLGQWKSEFERDATMRSKFLVPMVTQVAAAAAAAPPQGGQRGAGAGSQRRQRGSRGGRGKGGQRGTARNALFCYGYADPTKRCMASGACRYSHICASCGPPTAHTAAACLAAGTWVQSRADAAKAAAGM